jgi:hypothetical protein
MGHPGKQSPVSLDAGDSLAIGIEYGEAAGTYRVNETGSLQGVYLLLGQLCPDLQKQLLAG